MKRAFCSLLVMLLASLGGAAPLAADAQPYSRIFPYLLPNITQPSFTVPYEAESTSAPLTRVELWVRYAVDYCHFGPWTLWINDGACAGQASCASSVVFTAPAQGYYEFKTLAYDALGGAEQKTTLDDWANVDYGPPAISGLNPANGAVVHGAINVGAYFNDSWGLLFVGLAETTYGSVDASWSWTPPCAGTDRAGSAKAQERPGHPTAGPGASGAVEESIASQPGVASVLGMAGLPSSTYSTRWDTAKVPDGPVEICFRAEDLAYWNAPQHRSETCVTVIVNNYSARPPLLLATVGAAGPPPLAVAAPTGPVSFYGLARPTSGLDMAVELRVEATTGAVLASAVPASAVPASTVVPVGNDGRWSYSVPTVPPGAHTVSLRTRASNGAVSDWVTHTFDTSALPAGVVMLTRGYAQYVGAVETTISQWDPAASFATDKVIKVRSNGVLRSLARFDLASLPSVASAASADPSSVVRASLVWWVQSRSNAQAMTLYAYPLTQSWDPARATWLLAGANAPWSLPGAGAVPEDHLTQPTASASLPPDGWVVLDVTDFVKGWLSGAFPNHGFLLTGTSRGAVEYALANSNHTQAGFRPILVLEFAP